MTDSPPLHREPAFKATSTSSIVSRFWGFESLIGSALVKAMYYIGLVAILLGGLIGLFGALAMLTQNFVQGLGTLLVVAIGSVLALVSWRFACELAVLFFQIYNRLGDIRDRLPPR